MARITYGNTWWSAQWLHALAEIDEENRLPRGRSYANRGAVFDLRLHARGIDAGVDGSRYTPYKVTIRQPALSKADTGRLLDAICRDPALLARLLNRELDPALLALAEEAGVELFPESWHDLKMRCSCPDWAVPCKHIAAAMYQASRQIDANPFLLFTMRGVDLLAELRQRGLDSAPQLAQPLPSLAELTAGTADWQAEPDALAQLDFASVPPQRTTLLALLPPNPAFFPAADLREVLEKLLAKAGKYAQQLLAASPPTTAAHALRPDNRPYLSLRHNGNVRLHDANGMETVGALSQALAALPGDALADYQPQVAALHGAWQLALHLVARGAVLPQVFEVEGGALGVRWRPAVQSPEVAAQVDLLARALPPGVVQKVTGQTLAAGEQAQALCGLFIAELLREGSAYAQQKPVGDKLLALLFGNRALPFDAQQEREIGPALHHWLARFGLVHRTFTLVLQLDEQDEDTFALTLAVAGNDNAAAPTPLATILNAPDWQAQRVAILQSVALLADFYPPLDDYLRGGALQPHLLDGEALPALLFVVLPAIRLLGARVLLPKSLERLLRPRLSLAVRGKTKSSSSVQFSERDLLAFDWQLAIGSQPLSGDEFESLLGGAQRVVRLRGHYVYLDPAELDTLRTQLARAPKLDEHALLRAALGGEFAGAEVVLDAPARALLDTLRDSPEQALPAGLNASLRPYQLRGYAWLVRNLRCGFGGVIADDMGLGKTLQVICALLRLKEDGALHDGKALVVVPTSLLTNWQKEVARFAPGLSVGVFHGSKRELSGERPDLLLTTYGTARRSAAALRALPWRVLVADEAQHIKNPAAAQSKALKSIPAESYIAMSGTPVENRLSEYWSVLDFAHRGYLGPLAHFEKEYGVPIQVHRDQQALERFRRVSAPFLLRRLKSDRSIIQDLPEKVEQDQFCALPPAQAALYESVVREGLQVIAGESDAFKRQGLVLQMMLALKQICNHPAQFLKQPHGDPEASGKLANLFELLDALHARHEKALLFTQFRAMGELLSQWLAQRYGRTPMFLHGGLPRAKRDEMVERFQDDRTERVFVLSLKAAGTGLNLTAASTVIHFDLWWNPAVEAQATDRAYRIGQQQTVQVHRLICHGTFEEKVNEMMARKRELAELTVGSGELWIGDLPQQELEALFRLG